MTIFLIKCPFVRQKKIYIKKGVNRICHYWKDKALYYMHAILPILPCILFILHFFALHPSKIPKKKEARKHDSFRNKIIYLPSKLPSYSCLTSCRLAFVRVWRWWRWNTTTTFYVTLLGFINLQAFKFC